jgi:Peptidase family M23
MSHRTTARGVILLLLIGLTAVVASTSGAAKAPTKIIFPVVGPTQYTDDFGDPRAGGPHQGNDILAPRKALAVAAEAGKIKFWTTSATAGCMLYLYGASGTTYLYIHLNNDLGSGNDNKGKCVPGTSYAPGLKDGQKVTAGQRLGFVGDSGDANGIHPHLHFEVHPGGKAAADPYPYLQAAQHLLFSVPNGSVYTLSLAGKILSVTDATMTVAVSALKEWTTGRALKQVDRTVVLEVPMDASVQSAPAKGKPGRDLELAQAKKGMRVLVWTQPAVATLAAERGDEDEISAALVQLYLPAG